MCAGPPLLGQVGAGKEVRRMARAVWTALGTNGTAVLSLALWATHFCTVLGLEELVTQT